MNRKSYVHQISEIGPIERVRLLCERERGRVGAEVRRVDRRCRESEGKVKIEGYMSISDEEAHHRFTVGIHLTLFHFNTPTKSNLR